MYACWSTVWEKLGLGRNISRPDTQISNDFVEHCWLNLTYIDKNRDKMNKEKMLNTL